MSTMLVRIKPYNPRRGHVLRRFTYAHPRTGTRYRFDDSRGWYTVPTEVARVLEGVHSRYEDLDSPLAFDVCTKEQAIALDQRETVEEEPKAKPTRARSAVDAKPADDTAGKAPEPTKPEPEPEKDPEQEQEPDPDPLEEPEPTVSRRSRRSRASD